MRTIKKIPLHLIKIDRVPLDSKTLRYATALQAGAKFPPIKVAINSSGGYAIRDGRHRWTANKLVGNTMVLASFGVVDDVFMTEEKIK